MDMQNLSKAITALLNGKVIVYPTDTLYGLGADIFNEDAVGKIFEIKKRPIDNPLPIAVSDLESLEKIAFIDKKTKHLTEAFLPGKLTLILNKKDCVPDIVTGGLNKIAVRIPNNDIALKILSEFGPITATSANIHGTYTPGIISEISMQFRENDISLYLDVGRLEGKPSTIVDLTDNKIKIVREGAIPKKDIPDVI
jgi:L-threonylcarbamoyladenylate synthase